MSDSFLFCSFDFCKILSQSMLNSCAANRIEVLESIRRHICIWAEQFWRHTHRHRLYSLAMSFIEITNKKRFIQKKNCCRWHKNPAENDDDLQWKTVPLSFFYYSRRSFLYNWNNRLLKQCSAIMKKISMCVRLFSKQRSAQQNGINFLKCGM